jgi:hypothetical protein
VPSTSLTHPDLWSLARGQSPTIDPTDLLRAIEREVQAVDHLDYRTRLLIRDSINALSAQWGKGEPLRRMAPVARTAVLSILAEDFGVDVGFPSLEHRLMEQTDPELFLRFLRELGAGIRVPSRLEIGGSGALIIAGLLRRATEDIDAVDEVPPAIRADHGLSDSLATRYGLRLSHFQSHYLPRGWRDRLTSLGRFGAVDVFLVDPSDIFLSKLFSNREKDLDDLRVLAAALDKNSLAARLRESAQLLLAEPALRQNASRNWYIVYGEQLPQSK